MNRLVLTACAALFVASLAPAFAQTSTAMPTCASGDPVVWENTSSKGHVFHVSGDKYYGTTKHGKYVCESQAKTDGYHAGKMKGGSMSSGSMSSGSSAAAGASPAPMASEMPMGKHHKHRHGMGMASPAPSPTAS
jgi:hypothetical protein